MKGLVWKIALATAVLAVGFLVILQAQRGMTQALLKKSAEGQATSPSPATPAPEAVAATTGEAKTNPFGDPALAGNSSPSPGEPKANDAKVVPPLNAPELAGQNFDKTPEKSQPPKNQAEPAAPPASAMATVANDPFGDSGDTKHPSPGTSSKSAPSGAEIKQASASADVGGKGPDGIDAPPTRPTPIPDAGGPKFPGADGPSLEPAKPNDNKSGDTKTKAAEAPKQSEPPAGLEPPPLDLKPTDQKHADEKSSGGPQLPGPGPALDLPPAANNPSPAEKKEPPGAPSLTGSISAPPQLAAPTRSEPADKPPMKSASGNVDGSASQGSPKPFPEEGPKETPVPAPGLPAPSAGSSNANPSEPPVLDLTPVNPSAAPPAGAPNVPERKLDDAKKSGDTKKTVDATNGSPPGPRPAPEQRSESTTEFQGDGTVGDAPLGPQRPQLNIEKIAPQNALLGQPLVYSILVKNIGQSAARDVVVEDRIPKGTKLSGTIPRAELTGKKLVWRIGTLAAGEQRKISIRVIPQEAGEIGSVATVNFVAEAAAETVVTAPRLEFKISAPASARLGDLVPFHFEVRNIGTGEARGVVIRDLIPQGLSHSAGSDLEYEVGRLMPGKSKQLTLDLKAGKVGTAVNRAVVLAEGGLTTEAKAAIEISGSKVALSRTGPPRRYLGRQAVYANTLVNESSFPVDGVVLVESVPTGMEFSGATHGGQYNDGSRTIAWRIDQMAPGETRVVKSRLVARGLGKQTSTVRLTVPNGEPVETASQTEVEGFTAVGLDMTGVDGPVDLGEKITLRINARNKGTVAVTNLVVTVELPDQVEVISTRGPGKAIQEHGRVKFGPVPSLEGRTSAACEIVLAARKRGDSRVRVSIQADQIDKPLAREESILILSESSEAAASR